MASDQTLRAIITVLDRTAEPLRQINARFAAMSAPIRHIGSQIGELGELTGIKNIGEHAGHALEKVRGLGEGLLELAGPLAALSAAGSVAGLVEIAKSTGEFAEKLDIGAAMTGIATEKLAGWHYAAGLVNIDVDRLDRGFTFLNRTIADAAAGKAKEAQDVLRKMGLTNTPGHLVNTADALKAVATETKRLVDSGQIQLASSELAKLFGARQGAQLLPLFELGPEKLNEILAGAKEAGISLTAAQTAAGHGFMEQYKGMQASVEGLKIAIGDELFPVLTPVIEGMREWLNTNREWIATGIGDAIRDFSAWIKQIDWTVVKADMRAFGEDAKWVFHEIGGVKGVLVAIAAVELGPTIAAFADLGKSVAVAATKFVLFPVAEFVGSLAMLVPAIGGARDVMAAFDIALNANPIGAVILGATVLAGIGYEIYENWDGIKAFFENIWDGLPEGVKFAIEAFSPLITIPVEIIAHWKEILAFFKDVWGGLPEGVKFAIEAFSPLLTFPVEIIAHWKEISAFFKDMWSHIPSPPSWLLHWGTVTPGGGISDAAAAAAAAGVPIPDARPPLPTLPGAHAAAGGPLPGTAFDRGMTKIIVELKNLLPGSTVSTESHGNASPPDVDVGYAFAGM